MMMLSDSNKVCVWSVQKMQQISNRLLEFRSSIRHSQLASLMQKRRLEALRSEEEELLREISDTPQHLLTEFHLSHLIRLVNSDVTNALIILGNLVINRALQPQYLSGVEWQVGNSEYWPWLAHAFAEVGFCTREMFELCLSRIISKRSSFSLEHSLEVFLLSLKLGPQASECIRNSAQLVIALANHMMEGGERIPQLALTVMGSLTSQENDLPQVMATYLGEVRLSQALLQGLMKVQSRPRVLSIQVANNFLMSGIYLERVHRRILEQSLVEKQGVRLEISYYLKAFAETAHQNLILLSVKQHKLLQVLNNYSLSSSNPKHGQQIAENAKSAASIIKNRFQNSTNPQQHGRTLAHLEKLMDQSEEQTIYEEESARMLE